MPVPVGSICWSVVGVLWLLKHGVHAYLCSQRVSRLCSSHQDLLCLKIVVGESYKVGERIQGRQQHNFHSSFKFALGREVLWEGIPGPLEHALCFRTYSYITIMLKLNCLLLLRCTHSGQRLSQSCYSCTIRIQGLTRHCMHLEYFWGNDSTDWYAFQPHFPWTDLWYVCACITGSLNF